MQMPHTVNKHPYVHTRAHNATDALLALSPVRPLLLPMMPVGNRPYALIGLFPQPYLGSLKTMMWLRRNTPKFCRACQTVAKGSLKRPNRPPHAKVADPRNTPARRNAKQHTAREWQPEISNSTDAKKPKHRSSTLPCLGFFVGDGVVKPEKIVTKPLFCALWNPVTKLIKTVVKQFIGVS